MEELATVTSINKDHITVVSQIKSSCNSCSQVQTCASGQVAKAIPHKKLSFKLHNTDLPSKQSINVGDCVILTLPEVDLLSSAWQVYLLPILGLFSSSALGQWLVQIQILTHELFALPFSVLGGYLGYRIAKSLQSRPNIREKLQPQVLRVLPKPLDVET